MPWKECKPMDERLKFIGRLLQGEKMSPLCREFGISRVTGYKIYNRYKQCGLDGLYDRSRAPYRQANKLPFQVERTIVGIKNEYPSWGAPKIRDKLIRAFPMIPAPAVSTVHAALDRNGLVKRRKPKRYKATGTALAGAKAPNGLWCADYKGEFMPGNKHYCGRICIGSRKINLSVVFAGQKVGLREVDDQLRQVSFMAYDLGFFDNEHDRVESGPNPFAPGKVLTMCPE